MSPRHDFPGRGGLLRSALLLLALSASSGSGAQALIEYRHDGPELALITDRGSVHLRFHAPGVVEAFYDLDGLRQLPSFTLAAAEGAIATATELNHSDDRLSFASDRLRVEITKSPLRLSYWRGEERLLAEEQGYFAAETLRGFRFRLEDDEKLLGAGQRVLGMDRRGHRLPLVNRPHYGYGTESEQMYFSIPGVLSSRNYMLLFDNSARGTIDLGAAEPDILQFHAVAGRTGYIVAAGDSFPDTLAQYIEASGRPPLQPRWALGHYASRFGYRTEAEARAVVAEHFDQGFGLDAIVIDLYWFGPDIQGHMGNLAWDREAWPDPAGMMADFQALGVQTILVTEPFILTSSKRWDEAVAAGVLARNMAGAPRVFDFYFGNTGLIDVFSEQAADWFWGIYRELTEQGVGGWWGDLGEPEVHPEDTRHSLGMAEEIHNAYGHRWAELIHRRYSRDFPDRRPFIMMRAGAPGSQRYGMVPWTGDVDRSWDGLKPQVELALQMGLFGFGWIHSDLGGFAGGDVFDPELYTRWLQYGVFQPVYRPHAQEHIPPEPIFHDEPTRSIVRDFIRLRYRLAAYHYTLGWQHSQTGIPLMRPLFYLEPDRREFFDEANSYLWGDVFLVAPVTEPGATRWPVRLPRGVWFDFWSGERVEGGGQVERPVSLETIPVLVRAGSFLPLVDFHANARSYSSEHLELHYWHDDSVAEAQAFMIEDDGHSRRAELAGEYQRLDFRAEAGADGLRFQLRRSGDYPGAPASRQLRLLVHQPGPIAAVRLDGEPVPWTEGEVAGEGPAAWWEAAGRLVISAGWSEPGLTLELDRAAASPSAR